MDLTASYPSLCDQLQFLYDTATLHELKIRLNPDFSNETREFAVNDLWTCFFKAYENLLCNYQAESIAGTGEYTQVEVSYESSATILVQESARSVVHDISFNGSTILNTNPAMLGTIVSTRRYNSRSPLLNYLFAVW